MFYGVITSGPFLSFFHEICPDQNTLSVSILHYYIGYHQETLLPKMDFC
jgi:hypothetical protein